MSDDVVSVRDAKNNVSIEVEESHDGKTLKVSFTRFEKVAVHVVLTVPRRAAVDALRSFVTDAYVNEDVLANLLEEALTRM